MLGVRRRAALRQQPVLWVVRRRRADAAPPPAAAAAQRSPSPATSRLPPPGPSCVVYNRGLNGRPTQRWRRLPMAPAPRQCCQCRFMHALHASKPGAGAPCPVGNLGVTLMPLPLRGGRCVFTHDVEWGAAGPSAPPSAPGPAAAARTLPCIGTAQHGSTVVGCMQGAGGGGCPPLAGRRPGRVHIAAPPPNTTNGGGCHAGRRRSGRKSASRGCPMCCSPAREHAQLRLGYEHLCTLQAC